MSVIINGKRFCAKVLDTTRRNVSNAIDAFAERRKLKKYVKNMPKLSAEQKKAVKEYWKPYCKVSTDWARYYTYITGKFDPRYIPGDLPFRKIDQYLNLWKYHALSDKNNFSLMFPGIKQPRTIIRKIGNLLFSEDYLLIDLNQAESILKMRQEVVVKPTIGSFGGQDVRFLDTKNNMDELRQILTDADKKHMIIQDVVKQHPELAKMHPQSLNTVRIYTLMMEDGVHILFACLRMGANESRIDNGSAEAGIFAGIKENGELMERAYYDLFSGRSTDRHPQGMPLSEIKIPAFDEMKKIVKRAAQYAGNFRLIGWDLSVDETGDVVLIEANLFTGENPMQYLHGPFFGELTDRVLNEVFGRKKK